MYVVGIHLYMYITLPIRYTNISSQTEYSAGVSTWFKEWDVGRSGWLVWGTFVIST